MNNGCDSGCKTPIILENLWFDRPISCLWTEELRKINCLVDLVLLAIERTRACVDRHAERGGGCWHRRVCKVLEYES